MAKGNSTTLQRSELILQELLRNREVAVDKIAQKLKVSEATIRRIQDFLNWKRRGRAFGQILIKNTSGALRLGLRSTRPVVVQRGRSFTATARRLTSGDLSEFGSEPARGCAGRVR